MCRQPHTENHEVGAGSGKVCTHFDCEFELEFAGDLRPPCHHHRFQSDHRVLRLSIGSTEVNTTCQIVVVA
jgi:Rieske Fe-S protein